MGVKRDLETIGGLSNPSKMPCYGYSLPASSCPLGSQLATLSGTVCEGCYASKGAYAWATVQQALERRLTIVRACEGDPIAAERWIEAFARVLNARADRGSSAHDSGYFRWHDSGDLLGTWHLGMICGVAARTPRVRHWLPTRELPTVREYFRSMGGVPSNLTVRVSANRVDAPAPRVDGVAGSTVHSGDAVPAGAVECPARYQRNECGDCRQCWDPGVLAISYHKH